MHSDGTPVGGAIALALARVRLLAADAHRLGRRAPGDPGRQAAQRLVADALTDLELALQGRGGGSAGCKYKAVRYKRAERAFLEGIQQVIAEAPAGLEGGSVDPALAAKEAELAGVGSALETPLPDARAFPPVWPSGCVAVPLEALCGWDKSGGLRVGSGGLGS